MPLTVWRNAIALWRNAILKVWSEWHFNLNSHNSESDPLDVAKTNIYHDRDGAKCCFCTFHPKISAPTITSEIRPFQHGNLEINPAPTPAWRGRGQHQRSEMPRMRLSWRGPVWLSSLSCPKTFHHGFRAPSSYERPDCRTWGRRSRYAESIKCTNCQLKVPIPRDRK